MPRRHRRAPEAPLAGPQRPSVDTPLWAIVPGVDVRRLSGEKPYRCPGCDHEIRPRLAHLVVIPEGAAEERRHWHEVCWRQELRRTGGRQG